MNTAGTDVGESTIARLRELDDAYAARPRSARATDHLRRALERRALQAPVRTKLRLWPAVAFVAGALLMGVAVRMHASAPEPQTSTSIALEAVDDESGCARLGTGDIVVTGSRCLEDDGVRITAHRPSRLRRDAVDYWLLEGEVLFDVRPRLDDRIHVHAGEASIDVKGTRFVVRFDAEGGGVTLLEGRVAVRVGDAPPRDIASGEHVSWPSLTAAKRGSASTGPGDAPLENLGEPEAEEVGSRRRLTPTPVTKPAPPPTPDLQSLLAEVHALRERGKYEQAIARLREGAERLSDPRARQVISYETGMLLERQVRDPERACVHWREHEHRFGGGLYASLVRRSMSRLRCHESKKVETPSALESE